MNKLTVVITSLVLGVVMGIIWVKISEIQGVGSPFYFVTLPLIIAVILSCITLLDKNSRNKDKIINYILFFVLYAVVFEAVLLFVAYSFS